MIQSLGDKGPEVSPRGPSPLTISFHFRSHQSTTGSHMVETFQFFFTIPRPLNEGLSDAGF